MSDIVKIEMEPRDVAGKSANRALRREGYTPCVFYGPELPAPVAGKVSHDKITRLLGSGRWESARLLITLPGGGEEMCIVRAAQRDPLSGRVIHIDFMRLLKDRKITVNTQVRVLGREACQGIKDGGVLENLREIEIETLPVNIPEFIDVDVSALELGGVIHVSDLKPGEGIEILADPEEVVAIVAAPKAEEEAAEAEEKEVEVVGKGKKAEADDS
ncbi:MAG: 50S ribosomal protein L25 [Synergistaceae bacterium]|jgi:large subunit ribosomal protein L25|nr:50S ribosomal protein L25 [Synergistaceae bacterium]